MAKLNQIVAVATGKKSKLATEKTAIYKKLGVQALFAGLTRRYQPLNEEGEMLPPEDKNIQYHAWDAFADFAKLQEDLIDVVATQDVANCSARADVKVGDQVILTGVPVTHLMFLEKQLTDVRTFISHLPTLEPGETWSWSTETESYRSEAARTVRTQKVRKSMILVEATEHHPAQVEVYNEDIPVGYWSTVKFSGAVPMEQKTQLLNRVDSLLDAVKIAREEANMIDVENVQYGRKLLTYIMGGNDIRPKT